MHWRITVEAVDPIGDGYSKEFLVEKSLDDLTEGRLGCSIEDGKTIMAQIQKAVVERELDLWVRYRRVCQTCGGKLPIKDYQKRTILTVFGSVPVTYPRLLVCQKCSPWSSLTLSPATEICPDRATPELLEISASLGARMSYREASDILSTFLPCHLSRKFTTLRHRTLAIGKRVDNAERNWLWHESLNYRDRAQLELNMEGDKAREIIFSVDTAHIPLFKRYGGRTFEAVVGHCGRGGRGDTPGPVFAFEGTHPAELKSTATLALSDQGYAGRGEITVISDGAKCLKRLAKMLPQPVTHILDWFHVAMKIQPLAQLAATAPVHMSSFEQNTDRIKWRLWNGQVERALSRRSRSNGVIGQHPSKPLGKTCRQTSRDLGDLHRGKPELGHQLCRPIPGGTAHCDVTCGSKRERSRGETICKKATNAVVTNRCSLSAEGPGCHAQWKPVGKNKV